MWSLSGVDAGRFSIDDPGGALRFSIEPTGDDLFLQLPDFDDPLDDDSDGTYEVTVHVEGGGDQQTLDVEVTVTDEPEPGTLALSSTRPQLGETLTTTLTDPDGVTGAVTYVWERSVGRGTWVTLADTAASRVSTAADTGHFLRVTATYEDGHGTANTATARTSEVVTADRLTALTVSTTDSTANPGHALRPSFDSGILHYSIGCAASDTMTLTATAGTGVRLSINGTQVTSGESHTVAVEADGEVRVTLAAASGAATTYFVRCLSGDLLDMTATTAAGATGVIEDLIMFGVSKFGEQSVAIVDPNGAVRFHRKNAEWQGGYFRAAWVASEGGYRYFYNKKGGGQHWQILDQNLEFIDNVGTVAPLTKTDNHDAWILENGNYVLFSYEPADRDLSGLTFGNFSTSQRVLDAAIQIRTPDGTSLFDWNSYDAIPLEDCKPGFPPQQNDYAHINTVQMVDGHIVASFRGCSTVLRIDPDLATGDKVVWRLALTNLSDEQWDGLGKGPPPLDIIGDAEGQFCGQHGSSVLPNGHLILFDNGRLCMDDPWLNTQLLARPGGDYSRAVEYALDLDNGEAVFLRDHSLGGTRSRTGRVHGHVEALDNGDWLIGWGAEGTAKPYESVTQVDPNTGEEKFSIALLLNANGSSESIRPIPLTPVALADVLPPLEASIVAGARTSTVHEGAADRPTVAVAFNRPVVDFASTESAGVSGASIEGVAALVESGAPANAYVFTLVPDGDADIGFSLLVGMGCDTDPAGVCTADNTMLSVVPAASHTIGYEASNSQPEFAAGETGARSVAENTAAGLHIGAAVAAGDDDLDTLAYSITGADGAAFDLDVASGQLITEAPLDHESKDSYHFTLSVSDGKDANGIADSAIDDTIGVTVAVSDVNEAPVVSGPAAVSYDEAGTGAVAHYTATDPDDDNILWSLTGADSDDFEIDNSGTLRFIVPPPDYENPSDSGADNDYLVTVNASDGPLTVGPLTATVSVTVSVNNVEEAGTLTLSSQQPQAGTELVAALDDPDGAIENRSWSWQRSQDQTDWSIISGAGTGSYTPSEADIGYFLGVSVTYDDGEGTAKNAEQTSTGATRAAPITNHAPSFADGATERSVAENSPGRTPVGALVAATDDDNDPLDYSLSGDGAGSFSIDSDGQIRVGDNTTLDHEARPAYSVTVTATDPSDASDSIAVEITVTDVNEDPYVSIADATASEAAAAIRFSVALSAQSSQPVSVDYATTDRSATAGEDYTAATSTLTLQAGQTTATIEVQLIDDNDTEPAETFEITLDNPTNARVSPSAGTATGTITDNDPSGPGPGPGPGPGGGGGDEPVLKPEPVVFSDVAEDAWYGPAVAHIAAAGVTAGFPDGTYRPDELVSRAQMAVVLVQVLGVEPVAVPAGRFEDVAADSLLAGFVERIAELGVTAGCNSDGPLYCPEAAVDRSQMALFLKRALQLPDAEVDEASFEDVGAGHYAHEAVESLIAAGITAGCRSEPPPLFCAAQSVTRAHMAVFLSRALDYLDDQ